MDKGITVWMILSTILVFFMIPGLAFFYGGMTKRSSVLHTMMKSFIAIGFGGLLWVMFGYTIAFGTGGNAFFGSFQNIFLDGITSESMYATFPTYIYVMFQGMFAIIAVALISGAIIERTKFSAYVIFIIFWILCVYAPSAHWAWSEEGFLFKMGVIDLAGGTVIHISAGISAIVAALIIGPRKEKEDIPHNIPFVLLGTSILWFGWFGFNGGSTFEVNGETARVLLTTFIASCTGFVVFIILDTFRKGMPSVVGGCIGAVAGLVSITPAALAVTPKSSLLIGICGSLAVYVVLLQKHRFRFDDVLDVFACHGVAGIVGAILTGIFARTTMPALNIGHQLLIQCVSVLCIGIYAACITACILYCIKFFVGLRIDEDRIIVDDIDQHLHGEQGYQS